MLITQSLQILGADKTISDHSGGLGLDMVTVRPVAAGEQIYISYTELLAPTLVRQHTLLTNKLKLGFAFGFEFDFDLIWSSNFNDVGVTIA